MSLAAAHALAPDATFLVPDLERYRAAAEAALDALAAFAPYVEGETDPTNDGFGGAYLGIDGLERLWGEEPVMLGRIAVVVPHVPGPVRAGIAGTRFGALVAAIVARERLPGTDVTWLAAPAGDVETEAGFLAPLPVTFLPATAGTQERLRVLGVRRIGEFAALPRAAVIARFGAEGGFLHDLANGCDGRRILPRRPAERLRAEAELEPPVESLESLRFVLHRLADALCGQPRHGAGATLARLEVALESGALGVTVGNTGGAGRSARPRRAVVLPDSRSSSNAAPATARPEAVERLLLTAQAQPPTAAAAVFLELACIVRRGTPAGTLFTAGRAGRAPRVGSSPISRSGSVRDACCVRRSATRRHGCRRSASPGSRYRQRRRGRGMRCRELRGRDRRGRDRRCFRPRRRDDAPVRGTSGDHRRTRRPGRHRRLPPATAAASRWRSATAGGSRRRWWRRPIRRDYYKVAGQRLLALVYRDGVDGTWHLERLYD